MSNSLIFLHSTVSSNISSFMFPHPLFRNTSLYLWAPARFKSTSIYLPPPFYNGYFPYRHPLTPKTCKYQFRIFSYFLSKSIVTKSPTLSQYYSEQSVGRLTVRNAIGQFIHWSKAIFQVFVFPFHLDVRLKSWNASRAITVLRSTGI